MTYVTSTQLWPCDSPDEAGQRGPYGEVHSKRVCLTRFGARPNKGKIRVKAVGAKKKPLKPFSFKGFIWWTIQDLNL